MSMNIMSMAVTIMRLNMIHAVAMNTRSMSTIITNTAHAAAATTTNMKSMSIIITNMSTTMSTVTKVAAAATLIAVAATKAAFQADRRL